MTNRIGSGLVYPDVVVVDCRVIKLSSVDGMIIELPSDLNTRYGCGGLSILSIPVFYTHLTLPTKRIV